MTLAAGIPITRHDGNGVATTFAFNYQTDLAAELEVTLTQTNGTDIVLALTTDYTISTLPSNTVTVTFPAGPSAYPTLATGEQLTIRRVTAQDQSTAYKQNTLRVDEIESDSDHTMKVCQDIQEQINRCVKQDPSTATAVPSSDTIIAAAGAIADNGVYGAVEVEFDIRLQTAALAAGDGIYIFVVPSTMHGMNLTGVGAHVFTVSSSGKPTYQLYHVRHGQDILTTELTIDANEKDSVTASVAPVISTLYDDLQEGDEIRIDVDVAGTGTLGSQIRLKASTPNS
jgi:hypothetical protein